jgi:hypothetical protein
VPHILSVKIFDKLLTDEEDTIISWASNCLLMPLYSVYILYVMPHNSDFIARPLFVIGDGMDNMQ